MLSAFARAYQAFGREEDLRSARRILKRTGEADADQDPGHLALGTEQRTLERQPGVAVADLDPGRTERPHRQHFAAAHRVGAAPLPAGIVVEDRDPGAAGRGRDHPDV